jgi:hypothetical protein
MNFRIQNFDKEEEDQWTVILKGKIGGQSHANAVHNRKFVTGANRVTDAMRHS